MLVQNHRQVIPDFYGLTTSLHPADPQAQRDRAGGRAGRAVGQVHPRRAGAGDLDLLRRPRSRGPAAPDRRRADRPLPASRIRRATASSSTTCCFPPRRRKSSRRERAHRPAASGPISPGEIAAAGGREVSFVAQVDRDGVITAARAVARGTVGMVLALPGVAQPGEMLLHNHPSGQLGPVGGGPRRRRPAARRRRRLRHHRQRSHRALRRGRGAPRSRGGADRPVRGHRDAGRAAARWPGSWASTRIAGASATWRRTSPTATTTAACCCWRRAPG